MELQEEIKEIIGKHLPAQMADTLKQRLEDGEAAIRKVNSQGVELDEYVEQIAELQAEVSKLEKVIAERDLQAKELEDKQTLLSALERDVSNREQTLATQILTVRLEESQKRNNETQSVLSKLVSNSVYTPPENSAIEVTANIDSWSYSYGNQIDLPDGNFLVKYDSEDEIPTVLIGPVTIHLYAYKEVK